MPLADQPGGGAGRGIRGGGDEREPCLRRCSRIDEAGGHVGAAFLASGEPASKPSEPLAVRAGSLKITPYPNGPLGVSGSVEILSAA